nr:hypothetical protein B296_00023528 [Ipomoea trifida]
MLTTSSNFELLFVAIVSFLQAPNKGGSILPGKSWIFPRDFLTPPPPRVPKDVHIRGPGLREASGGGHHAGEIHPRPGVRQPVQSLRPPLVRRDSEPAHIPGGVHQERDLLRQREALHQISHPGFHVQPRVAERQALQTRVLHGVAGVDRAGLGLNRAQKVGEKQGKEKHRGHCFLHGLSLLRNKEEENENGNYFVSKLRFEE